MGLHLINVVVVRIQRLCLGEVTTEGMAQVLELEVSSYQLGSINVIFDTS